MTQHSRWLLAGAAILLVAVPAASGHPGRTNSSGCHTCRTNCSKWGLRNGQYHCHGGSGSSRNRSGISRTPPPPPSPSPPAARPIRIIQSEELSSADASLPENSIVLRESPKQTAGISVEVLVVVDGDTFVARQGQRLYLMKLRDVEAPELEQTNGPEARQRLTDHIAGSRLVVWPAKPEGCLVPVLAETLDGADVAELLLVEGYVWAIPSASESWRRLEAMARRKMVGLWLGLEPEPPWEFRARSTMD